MRFFGTFQEPTPMSAAGPSQGANCSPSGGSAAAAASSNRFRNVNICVSASSGDSPLPWIPSALGRGAPLRRLTPLAASEGVHQ